MVVIKRTNVSGSSNNIKFSSLKDAFRFLKSEEFKHDTGNGFKFEFVEEDIGKDPDGG